MARVFSDLSVFAVNMILFVSGMVISALFTALYNHTDKRQ